MLLIFLMLILAFTQNTIGSLGSSHGQQPKFHICSLKQDDMVEMTE